MEGGIAFIIKNGRSYTVADRTFNPREATAEYDSLVIYPFCDTPFSICNVYSPPTANEAASFNGGGLGIYGRFFPCANLFAGL